MVLQSASRFSNQIGLDMISWKRMTMWDGHGPLSDLMNSGFLTSSGADVARQEHRLHSSWAARLAL